MKSLTILFSIILSCTTFAAPQAAPKTIPALKQALKTEVKGLHDDLNKATSEVDKLGTAKAKLEVDLKDMEDWGIGQQAEKDKYYAEAVELGHQVDALKFALESKKKALIAEKISHDKDIKKYHKLKHLVGFIVGSIFAFLFAYLLSPMLVLAGPWALVGRFLGPVGAFGLGFALVQLIF